MMVYSVRCFRQVLSHKLGYALPLSSLSRCFASGRQCVLEAGVCMGDVSSLHWTGSISSLDNLCEMVSCVGFVSLRGSPGGCGWRL